MCFITNILYTILYTIPIYYTNVLYQYTIYYTNTLYKSISTYKVFLRIKVFQKYSKIKNL